MIKLKAFYLLAVGVMSAGASLSGQENGFTHRVGDLELILLSERQGNASESILIGATGEMLTKYAPDGKVPNAVNAFLLRMKDGGITLFDTGLGQRLNDNLADLNFSPEDVEVIFLTHMHGDHVGGMMKDGAAVFPDAIVNVSADEALYWRNLPGGNPGKTVLELYKDHLIEFKSSDIGTASRTTLDERGYVRPDERSYVTPFKAYGHTPGHTVFLIESKGEKLLVWGDLTHALAIQMPEPQVAVTYDVDPQEAVKARLRILEYVAENNIPIAGMHVPYPGMGYVVKEGGGYRFIPLTE